MQLFKNIAMLLFGQQGAVADLLFVEARSTSDKSSVFELCPDI